MPTSPPTKRDVGDAVPYRRFTVPAFHSNLHPAAGAVLLGGYGHGDAACGQLRQPRPQRLRRLCREGHAEPDVRAVLGLVHRAAQRRHLAPHPLEQRVGARDVRRRPQSHLCRARRRQRVPCAFGIRPCQAARAQQDAAEIPRHHAHHVGDVLPLEHVQHGLSRRALGLAVVAIAQNVPADEIAPAVMPGVVILLLHLRDEFPRLLLRLHRQQMADEAGALFGELRLRRLIGYAEIAHSHSSFGSVQPSM